MKKRIIRMGMAVFFAAVLMGGTVPAGSLSAFDSADGEDDLAMSYAEPSVTGDVIALDDIGISVVADNYTSIREDGDGFVYIYTMSDDSIPYVLIGKYDMEADDFADQFTAYMRENYPDLRITYEAAPLTLAGNTFTKIMYEYAISGYTATDTRIFYPMNGVTYMFASKEIPAIDYVLPANYLEQVASSVALLAGGWSDYGQHVDSEHTVDGPDPSVADLGGQTGIDPAEGPSVGGSVGGPVGGAPVGGVDTTDSKAAGTITFREDAANYEGVWVPFSDGFQLYLPANWDYYNLTDEQRQNGVLYQAGDSSTDVSPAFLSVNYTGAEGAATLDDLTQILQAGGFSVEGIYDINGIECVSYSSEAQNLSGLMFFHPMYPEYVIAVVGANYAQNVDTIAAILCSLSPYTGY